MNDLWELYQTVWQWSEKLPNIKVISFAASEYGILICFTWNSDMQYNLLFTADTLQYANFDLIKTMLEEAERQYKVWEVGEE